MNNEDWTLIIKARAGWWNLRIGDIIRYKDLLFLFVRRDFVALYKQTVLGPLWFFIQPLFSTVIFTFVFSHVAGIPTDGIPPVLFYMTGVVAWTYFADCLNKTSNTFTGNVAVFGKVYFPRMVVPLSVIMSNLLKFGIQFALMLCFLGYYMFSGDEVHPNIYILLTPILLIMMAGLGLGFGLIVSSMTTKYRDLQFLIGFAVQLMMYITPIVFPLSFFKEQSIWIYRIVLANPLTSIIETFKFAFLGNGIVDPMHLTYSFVFMIVLMIVGINIFHRVEKNFLDSV